MGVIHQRIGKDGTLTIPASVRDAVGLSEGGEVIVEVNGPEIRIRRVEDHIDEAQRLVREAFAGRPMPTVDEFLKERREAAARE